MMNDEEVVPRQPARGEWVNGNLPNTYSDGRYGRNGAQVLGRVVEVKQGSYCGQDAGGCIVEPWHRASMAFGAHVFLPWCCVISRAQVSRYSLTGEMADMDLAP